jgi:hypothetical protein
MMSRSGINMYQYQYVSVPGLAEKVSLGWKHFMYLNYKITILKIMESLVLFSCTGFRAFLIFNFDQYLDRCSFFARKGANNRRRYINIPCSCYHSRLTPSHSWLKSKKKREQINFCSKMSVNISSSPFFLHIR